MGGQATIRTWEEALEKWCSDGRFTMDGDTLSMPGEHIYWGFDQMASSLTITQYSNGTHRETYFGTEYELMGDLERSLYRILGSAEAYGG